MIVATEHSATPPNQSAAQILHGNPKPQTTIYNTSIACSINRTLQKPSAVCFAPVDVISSQSRCMWLERCGGKGKTVDAMARNLDMQTSVAYGKRRFEQYCAVESQVSYTRHRKQPHRWSRSNLGLAVLRRPRRHLVCCSHLMQQRSNKLAACDSSSGSPREMPASSSVFCVIGNLWACSKHRSAQQLLHISVWSSTGGAFSHDD